jgi:flagellar hook-basal body complex protein FliE
MSSRSISSSHDQVLNTLKQIQNENNNILSNSNGHQPDKIGKSFMDHLKSSISDVNNAQKVSDRMAMELSTGQSNNIHETMISASRAELSFNLMVQIRNKALEAYNEIMRMPV